MNTKKVSLYLAAACLAACVFAAAHADDAPASAVAPAPKISTELDQTYISKYVWRGTVPNPNAAYQPSLTLTFPAGFSYNLWGSVDTTNVHQNQGKTTELDHTFNYAWNAPKCTWNTGLIHYTFPNTTSPDTTELYASACLNNKFSPSLGANWDVQSANGVYFNVSTGYNCPMHITKQQSTALNVSAKLAYATASYNNFYFGVDKNSLVDFVLSASLPFSVSKIVKVTPTASYSMVADSSIRNALAATGVSADNFFGGVTASASF